jgi:hypothetical protein
VIGLALQQQGLSNQVVLSRLAIVVKEVSNESIERARKLEKKGKKGKKKDPEQQPTTIW